MDKDLFSNSERGKTNVEQDEMLQAVLHAAFGSIRILEPVRDKSNHIVDFRYLFANDNGHRSPGNNIREARSFLSMDIVTEKTGLFKRLVTVMESGNLLDEILHYHHGEIEQWFHVKARKINKNSIVLSREEITEKKKSDQRVKELERLISTRNRELKMLSLELKAFNTIAADGYAESLRNLYTSLEFIIAQDAKNLSDAGKAHIRRTQSSIQKMKLLTDDIIAYSNVQPQEELTPVKLNEILSIVINGLQQKIQESSSTVDSGSLPEIAGRPALLILLFTHLLENAIKFRKEGRSHQIRIKNEKMSGQSIADARAQKDIFYYKITVEDNGSGFEKEHQEKIFDIFYRPNNKDKPKSSGIGLPICKKIMEMHGGFIAAECNPDCTTFHCFFPEEKR